jgi:hypothetical protein
MSDQSKIDALMAALKRLEGSVVGHDIESWETLRVADMARSIEIRETEHAARMLADANFQSREEERLRIDLERLALAKADVADVVEHRRRMEQIAVSQVEALRALLEAKK